ncbi:MFS transporter [Nocardia sp. NPDC088792]|uniref:MFS transporter n=1 Tax=Nocardia sp. NPDC088792 TaxID=3364332 RepID=UPI0038163E2E
MTAPDTATTSGRQPRKRLVLAICCTAVLMANLDTTALNVALPSIGRELHASVSSAQWAVAAYTVVLACLLMLFGSIADRIGRRTVFQAGLVVFGTGSLLCSLAPSPGWLVAFRMVQAVGGAMLNPVAMSIIINVFPRPAERARAVGAWSGTTGISMAAGPVIGGALVDAIGWRAIFWINVPIALCAFVLTTRFVPQSRAAVARRLDPVGQLLVIGLLGPLVFAIIEGPHRGWGSPVTIGCLLLSLVCVVGLLSYEPRRTDPLIEVRAFASPPFAGAVVIAICAYIAMGGFLFLNTYFLQGVRNDRPLVAGLELLPMAAAMLVAGPLWGRSTAERGDRLTLTVGGALTTFAAVLLTFTFDGGNQVLLLFGYAVFGLGIGYLNTPITTIVTSGLPRSEAGVAASIATTSRQIGQSLGVAIIGSILAATPGALDSVAAFHTPARICWSVLTGAALTALLVARVAPARSASPRTTSRRRPKTTAPQ